MADFPDMTRIDPALPPAEFAAAVHTLVEEAAGNDTSDQSRAVHQLANILDCYLEAGCDNTLSPDKLDAVIQGLRTLLGPRGRGNMVMAQIRTRPGDLPGNAKKIMRTIRIAEAIGADCIVFPEMALMGYPIQDVILRYPDLVEQNIRWLNAIAERTGETQAILGFVELRKGNDGQRRGKPFFNSAAILANGKIRGIVRKSLLPSYSEFDDSRTFEPSPVSGIQPPETLNKPDSALVSEGEPCGLFDYRAGISVCEDIWADGEFFDAPGYAKDPIEELMARNPDILINISASPTRTMKEQLKHHMLSHVAARYRTPLIYVNRTGAVDGISFDGASRMYDETGQLVARAKSFDEQFMIVNPFRKLGVIEPLPEGQAETLTVAAKVFDAYDETDLSRTCRTIVQSIRDYFQNTGFRRAVLGLSGGLDSSVAAVLLADALGPDNVLGVSMPSRITPAENRSDAEILAKNLGIRYLEIPIKDTVDVFSKNLAHVQDNLNALWGEPVAGSAAADNLQAINRATFLRLIGNNHRALPIATSDKSELYLGYATVNGDMSGAFAPIGDVSKTKVKMLARWLNNHRPGKNAIPDRVIEKPPGADLSINPATGETVKAEDVLPPYEFTDEVIWRIESLNQGYEEILAAPFQYERKHPLPPDRKRELLDRFYHFMKRAVFKWHIAPPMVNVDGYGIQQTQYRQPIVAQINERGLTAAEIADVLDQAQTVSA